MLQHLPAEVASDGHQGLLTGLAFSNLGDAAMPQVMKPYL